MGEGYCPIIVSECCHSGMIKDVWEPVWPGASSGKAGKQTDVGVVTLSLQKLSGIHGDFLIVTLFLHN